MNRAASGSLASTSGRSCSRTPSGQSSVFRNATHAPGVPHWQRSAGRRLEHLAHGVLPEDVGPTSAEGRTVFVHEPITLSIGGMDHSDPFNVSTRTPATSPLSEHRSSSCSDTRRAYLACSTTSSATTTTSVTSSTATSQAPSNGVRMAGSKVVSNRVSGDGVTGKGAQQGSSSGWSTNVEMGNRKHDSIQKILHARSLRDLHELVSGLGPHDLDSARIKCGLLRLSQLCSKSGKLRPGPQISNASPAASSSPVPDVGHSLSAISRNISSPIASQSEEQQLVDKLLQILVHNVPILAASLDPRTLSTIATSLAKMGHCDVQLLQSLLTASWSLLPDMTPSAAASLLWAFRRFQLELGFPVSTQWTSAMLNVFLSRVDSCSPADLSMAITTIAHLPLEHRPSLQWLAAVALHVQQNVDKFSGEQLSRVLHAVASLGLQPSGEWMDAVLARVHSDKGSLSTATPLTSLLHSLLLLRHRPGGAWMKSILSQAQGRLNTFTSNDLSCLAWALAKMQYRPNDSFLSAFERIFLRRHVSCLVSKSKARIHATVLWALATLQIKPRKDWLKMVTAELPQLLPCMSKEHVVTVLWSMQRIGIVPRGALMDEVILVVSSHILLYNTKQCLIILLALSRYVRGKKARRLRKIDGALLSSLCARLSPSVAKSQTPLTFKPPNTRVVAATAPNGGPRTSSASIAAAPIAQLSAPSNGVSKPSSATVLQSQLDEHLMFSGRARGSDSHSSSSGTGTGISSSSHSSSQHSSLNTTAQGQTHTFRPQNEDMDKQNTELIVDRVGYGSLDSNTSSSSSSGAAAGHDLLQEGQPDRVAAGQQESRLLSDTLQVPRSRLQRADRSSLSSMDSILGSMDRDGLEEGEPLGPCEIKSLLVAVARLREPLNQAFHEDLLKALSANLKALTPRQLAGSLTAVCYLAHSTGRHLHMREDLALLPRMVKAIAPHLGSYDFLCLTLIAKGLAVMRYVPSARWLSAHEGSCVRLVEAGGVAAKQIAMLVKAYRVLKYDPTALKVSVFERMLEEKSILADAGDAGDTVAYRRSAGQSIMPSPTPLWHPEDLQWYHYPTKAP